MAAQHAVPATTPRKYAMTTSITALLAPYAAALAGIRDRDRGRLTLAEALIRREAAHVAEVRREMPMPLGGWKNALPLEHYTQLGRFIKGSRTGNMQPLRISRAQNSDADLREIADTLLNAENVYVDAPECRAMTTDELIAYAADARYFAQGAG
jgi:hypothetical protein